MSPPKLRLIHGYQPHQCIILGIKPTTTSGWSIFVRGERFASGTATTISERCDVIEKLRSVALDEELHVVIVAEDWIPGGPSWQLIIERHEAWGRWDESLQLTGFTDFVRAQAVAWRTDIYGKGSAKMKSGTAKALAKVRVLSSYRIRAGDDEAEAILIGEWGCRSSEVGALLAA